MGKYLLPCEAEDNLLVKTSKTANLDTISIQIFYIHMHMVGGYSQEEGGGQLMPNYECSLPGINNIIMTVQVTSQDVIKCSCIL